MDKFKEANDTFGHATGDKILIEFGDILMKIMPESAVIARLGGDEFAVLLPGVSENQAEFLIKLVQAEMTVTDMVVTASLDAYTRFLSITLMTAVGLILRRYLQQHRVTMLVICKDTLRIKEKVVL